tara:strand:- start:143 stop:460 length:318 start_codon:yes stop_codon:yes gene_type:complete
MYQIICTTTDSINIANKITETILANKYSPCVQITPNVSSYYIWKNKINNSIEYKIDIKTSSIYIEEIIEIIKNNHNYEIPEIVSSEIKILDDDYKKWFESNIRKE